MESFLILLPVFKRMLMLPRRWNTICQMMRTYLSWECQNQILKAVTKVVRIFVPHCETFLSAENSLINVATEAVDHLCIDRRKCLYSLSSLVIIALNFDQWSYSHQSAFNQAMLMDWVYSLPKTPYLSLLTKNIQYNHSNFKTKSYCCDDENESIAATHSLNLKVDRPCILAFSPSHLI